MRKQICHNPCSASIQKQIREALGKLSGTVENIYFHPDADFKQNAKKKGAQKHDDIENLKHRFLLSVVIACPLKNQTSGAVGSPLGKRSSRRNRGNAVLEENASTSPFLESRGVSTDLASIKMEVDEGVQSGQRDILSCKDTETSSDAQFSLNFLKTEPLDDEMDDQQNWDDLIKMNVLPQATELADVSKNTEESNDIPFLITTVALPESQPFNFINQVGNTPAIEFEKDAHNSPVTSDYHSDQGYSQNKDIGSNQKESEAPGGGAVSPILHSKMNTMTLAEVKSEPQDDSQGSGNDSEQIYTLSDIGTLDLGSDFWDKVNELVKVSENSPGLFPLTPEKLHATIDEQLSKSSSENPENFDWKSSLFNEVSTNPEPEQGQTFSKTAEQFITIPVQSNPVSSMNSATTASFFIDSSLQPFSYQQQQSTPHAASGVNQVAYSLTSSSQQKNGLRPAILPAASSLVTVGNGGTTGRISINYPARNIPMISKAGNSAANANIIRLPKPGLRLVQAHPRPGLLLPKINGSQPSTSFSTPSPATRSSAINNLRSRKTSPLMIKPTTSIPARLKLDEKREQTEVPRSVPEGYTYESWILQEGLHKARKLGLHRNTEKDFFPFTCPLCDKKYRNPNGIKYHAKYAHGPKCIFTCETCEKTYATRHGLAAHKRAHETTKIEKELELERKKQQNKKTPTESQSQPPFPQNSHQPLETITLHEGNDNVGGLEKSSQSTTVLLTSIKSEVVDFE